MNYYVILVPIVLTVMVALVQPNEKVCPFVRPLCKCVPTELCREDKNCAHGQKCCLDCCGGHRCTDPVEEQKCNKPHEEYKTCGSACPRTCNQQKPGPCIMMCVQGCFCKDDYLRNENGDCVKEHQC